MTHFHEIKQAVLERLSSFGEIGDAVGGDSQHVSEMAIDVQRRIDDGEAQTDAVTSVCEDAVDAERELMASALNAAMADAGHIMDWYRIEYYGETPHAVLRGWMADDGNCELHFPNAACGAEAAQLYVDGGNWGNGQSTEYVRVTTWRRAYYLDLDIDDLAEDRVDEGTHIVAIEPTEPPCTGGGHDWRRPLAIVGGLAENPGVHGHGADTIISECCIACGCRRETHLYADDGYGSHTKKVTYTQSHYDVAERREI